MVLQAVSGTRGGRMQSEQLNVRAGRARGGARRPPVVLRLRAGDDAVSRSGGARGRALHARLHARAGRAGGARVDAHRRCFASRPRRDRGERRAGGPRCRLLPEHAQGGRLSHRGVLPASRRSARRPASGAASTASTRSAPAVASPAAPPTTRGAPAIASSAAATPARGAPPQALRDWVAAEPRAVLRATSHYREPARAGRTAGAVRPHVPAAARRGAAERADDAGAAAYDGALRYVDLRLQARSPTTCAAAGRWDHTPARSSPPTHGDAWLQPGARAGRWPTRVLRVPLLLRCPARIPRGFVVDEFAQPTDCCRRSLRSPAWRRAVAPVQGRSLLGAHGRDRRARTPSSPRPSAAAGRHAAPAAVRRKAMRTRREKFVWQSDEANALFDLGRDPARAAQPGGRRHASGPTACAAASSIGWRRANAGPSRPACAAVDGAGDRARERQGARE